MRIAGRRLKFIGLWLLIIERARSRDRARVRIALVKYAPGGDGSKEAEAHFNDCVKKQRTE